MAAAKVNVLVYSGPGVTSECLRLTFLTLRTLLTPSYAVAPLSEASLLREPWPPTCALLVIPGGADHPLCKSLHGLGVSRITSYVRSGGSYLGLCSGGYFASMRCEFDCGPGAGPGHRVIGPRELAFFPGTCRGPAFSGFEYANEKGARAARLAISHASDCVVANPDQKQPVSDHECVIYWKGGGIYVDAHGLVDRGVEVLATYADNLDVDLDPGDKKAAIIYCKVGSGGAVLTGPHPEFPAAGLRPQPSIPGYDRLVSQLAAGDSDRLELMRTCLRRLGLVVNDTSADMLSLTPLHLSSLNHTEASELAFCLNKNNGISSSQGRFFHGNENRFRIVEPHQPSSSQVATDVPVERAPGPSDEGDQAPPGFDLVVYEDCWPDAADAPSFRHDLYYHNLQMFHKLEPESSDWGRIFLYGDVVTSTNSVLEKNPLILSQLPTGFTFSARNQIAGRGRGNNVWITPSGSLCVSVVINYPAHLLTAPGRAVVFLQYLAALAVVEAVHGYDSGLYERLPIKLKWPNDIYALDPKSPPSSPSYVKIGGILSNCIYSEGSYQVVMGIGINTKNNRPTLSLDSLLSAAAASSPVPAAFCIERLLARLVTRLGSLYTRFRRNGFTGELEQAYYSHWLHSGQVVTLEAEGGVRARVLGLTPDWGMLKVEELDINGLGRRQWALQSDENSFDFWRGLVRRKAY